MSTYFIFLVGLAALVFWIGVMILFFSSTLLGAWIATQFLWSAIVVFFVGVFSEKLGSAVVFKVALTLFSGFSIFALFFLSLLTRAQLLKKVTSLEQLRGLRR